MWEFFNRPTHHIVLVGFASPRKKPMHSAWFNRLSRSIKSQLDTQVSPHLQKNCWTFFRMRLWKYDGPFCRLWWTHTRSFLARLHNISESIRGASADYATYGLDKFHAHIVMTSTDSGFTAMTGASQYLIMPKHMSKELAEPMNINWKTSSIHRFENG